MRPLLVVAHEGTRTGAPKVLLELLRFSRGRLPAPLCVRLLRRGSLSNELEGLSEVPDRRETPAAVLVNGASAAGELFDIDAQVPAMAYVHEEGDALAVLEDRCVDALRDRCNRVLCVSPRSAADLEAMGVDPGAIGQLAPVVPGGSGTVVPRAAESPSTESGPGGIARLVYHANGVEDRPIVVGCGEADWRKGADLFVDVARRVAERRSATFVWAGRRPRAFARLLDNDTRTLGLQDHMFWLGEVPDASDLLEQASVVVMTSREDPQPLVPLEAAGFGTAVVGFHIGGVADLADLKAARTVPFPDTAALATEVVSLLDQPELRSSLAAAALAQRELNNSIEVVGPRFLEEIQRLMGTTGDRGTASETPDSRGEVR